MNGFGLHSDEELDHAAQINTFTFYFQGQNEKGWSCMDPQSIQAFYTLQQYESYQKEKKLNGGWNVF